MSESYTAPAYRRPVSLEYFLARYSLQLQNGAFPVSLSNTPQPEVPDISVRDIASGYIRNIAEQSHNRFFIGVLICNPVRFYADAEVVRAVKVACFNNLWNRNSIRAEVLIGVFVFLKPIFEFMRTTYSLPPRETNTPVTPALLLSEEILISPPYFRLKNSVMLSFE